MENKILSLGSSQNNNSKLTSIIILTYNQLSYTQLCIGSIRDFTPKGSYEIIIIDNNSNDGTVDWLQEQSDLKVILNSENKGFPAGCNQGIKISNGDNILLLNNDTIVTPNWLNNLCTALYSSDDIGAVGAVSNNCSNYQQISPSYKNIEEMINFASTYNISNPTLWKLKTKLVGFCLLIKKEVLDKVGLLDEIFTPGNFEDDDLSYRIICNGYKLLLCQDTFIHHFGSTSFKSNSQNFIDIFNKNAKKFNNKWGFDSSYSSLIRLELIDLIKENPLKNFNILEVGCGVGSTLLEIKNRYKNANLYGFEISEGSGKVAQSICNCIIGNIENKDLPYNENFFDYIIFGDVLEHLNDPWKTLSDIKKYLKKDGYIISSIPNIMHVSVVSKLLNGYFTYSNSGILDKTHLRFFTLDEIENLFSSCEYSIESTAANVIALSKEEEDFIDKLCSISGDDLKQQYGIYQYIIKAKSISIQNEFDSETLFELRKSLLELDTSHDIGKGLNSIFKIYSNNTKLFESNLKYYLDKTVINGELVLNTILNEANTRNIFINL